MSKYVRTKCKVYPVCQAEDRWKEIGYRLVGSEIVLIPYNDIIKEADTIEELCDEIIIRHFNLPKPFLANEYQKKEILKDRQEAKEYGVEEVKFAIWVGMDLINVAKMNEKGELELI